MLIGCHVKNENKFRSSPKIDPPTSSPPNACAMWLIIYYKQQWSIWFRHFAALWMLSAFGKYVRMLWLIRTNMYNDTVRDFPSWILRSRSAETRSKCQLQKPWILLGVKRNTSEYNRECVQVNFIIHTNSASPFIRSCKMSLLFDDNHFTMNKNASFERHQSLVYEHPNRTFWCSRSHGLWSIQIEILTSEPEIHRAQNQNLITHSSWHSDGERGRIENDEKEKKKTKTKPNKT